MNIKWILVLFLIMAACNPFAKKERNVVRVDVPEIGDGKTVYTDKAERFALVIGNSDYQQVDELLNPQNDAEDMAEALEKLNSYLCGVKI